MRRWRESGRDPFAALNAGAETLKYFPDILGRAACGRLAGVIECRSGELGYGLRALEIAEAWQFIGFTGISPLPPDAPGAGGIDVTCHLLAPHRPAPGAV